MARFGEKAFTDGMPTRADIQQGFELPKLADNRLVAVTRLRPCKLWTGSMEEQRFQYGGLRVSDVKDKIAKLEACDDRTPNEEEYLSALRATLEL